MTQPSTAQITEHPVRAEEGFDNRVHIRDRQTGRLIRLQHYALHIHGETKMYEQPIGSGNMFDAAGHAIGQWEQETDGRNTRWKQVSEDHMEVELKFYADKEEYLEDENRKLREELAAIKTEQEDQLHTTSHEPKNLAKAKAERIPDIPSDLDDQPQVTISEEPVSKMTRKK